MRLLFFFGILLINLSCKSFSKENSALMPYDGTDGIVQENESQKIERRNQPAQVRFPRPWRFWLDSETPIAAAAAELNQAKADEARILSFLAVQSVGSWYRGPFESFSVRLAKQLSGANEQEAFALMVLDNLPYRDCATDKLKNDAAAEYERWIGSVTGQIADSKTVVILEPQGIARLDCLSAQLRQERLDLLRTAVGALKKGKNTLVYIDAGGPGVLKLADASSRLKSAGIDDADGVALNTGQYQTTEAVLRYGLSLRRSLGSINFVIDTSRNGKGLPPGAKACNPAGAAVGELPIEVPDDEEIDSFVWLKGPGESDGSCGRNEPPAGTFFKARALQLAREAGL